ncbi:MAG: DinB family protein [Rhodobacteraceae bacterium]|nr:DinB family protein [Paracoccaceae bacterium]
MITPGWCHTMARYNAWQNENIVSAADTLDDSARRADRGAFFGSIAGTLSHLLWGDLTWMSRLDGGAPPGGGIKDSPALFPDWQPYLERRRATDRRILDWAARLEEHDLEGDLRWFSGALGREVTRPRAICVMQMFNHQTHHRGQVHAMLTAAGARPGDTDIFIMPESI